VGVSLSLCVCVCVCVCVYVSVCLRDFSEAFGEKYGGAFLSMESI